MQQKLTYHPQVRLAAYIQSISNTILLGVSSKRPHAARATLILTSLATVATTAIFALKSSLSLAHLMIATDLMTVMMLPLHIVESWRSRSPALFVAEQVRLAIYLGVQLWLILKTPCLGSHPECNFCTRSVAFAFEIGHVVSHWERSWRIFWVGVVCFVWFRGFTYFYGLFHFFDAIPAMFSDRLKSRWIRFAVDTQHSVDSWRVHTLKYRQREWALAHPEQKAPRNFFSVIKFFIWFDDETTVREEIKRKQWSQLSAQKHQASRLMRAIAHLKLALRTPRFQRAMIAILVSVSWIISTERFVALNTTSANTWGFGQIFALIATVPSVASLVKLSLRIGRADV